MDLLSAVAVRLVFFLNRTVTASSQRDGEPRAAVSTLTQLLSSDITASGMGS